jgi:AbiU2
MDDFKEWSEWVQSIEKAVTKLCVGREVYKQILEMYRQNPAIQTPNIFYSWMRGLFVTWFVAFIGRLVDDKRGTRSFVRLLRSLQKHSDRVSREHHISLYVVGMQNFSDQEAGRIACREFDRLVGPTNDFLPKQQVEADIATLLQVTKPIMSFRHERVAHLDENPSEQLPTYEHLDRAIVVLVELLRKYALLIKGVSADPFPTIQYDWLAIFRVPWITANRS